MKFNSDVLKYGVLVILAIVLYYGSTRPEYIAKQEKKTEANRRLFQRLFHKTEA